MKPQTIRNLDTAICDALAAMRHAATYLEEHEHLQAAHHLMHRVDALDRAAGEFAGERIMAMSEDELREEMAAEGLDYDESADAGHALVQRLIAEHRERNGSGAS